MEGWEINGVKQIESVVKCTWVKFKWQEVKCSEVKCSSVKCSEIQSNWVSNIIRGYIHHTQFAVYVAFSFIIFLHVLWFFSYHYIYSCMFYKLCLIILGIYFYVYVFLLLCVFFSVYSVFILPTGTLRLP